MKNLVLSIVASLLLISCNTAQPQGPVEVKNMSPTQFKTQQMGRKTVLVDVRTAEEYAAGHLDGASNTDYRNGDFAKKLESWDKDKVYYLYCASGNRSSKAAALLKEAGFKHIYDLGAYPVLKEAGLPITTEPN